MPLNVTPSGSLSLPFASFATLLSNSQSYQTAVGASGPSAAATAFDTIHWPYLDLSGSVPALPLAVLSDFDGLHQWKKRDTFEESGQLLCEFYFLPDPNHTDARDVLLTFRNTLGAILQDCLNNARNPVGDGTTYFGMTQWTKHDTPQQLRAVDTDLLQTSGGNPVNLCLFASFVIDWIS